MLLPYRVASVAGSAERVQAAAAIAKRDVAVVIVNYGTAELTIEAVESVLSRDHGGRKVEVHVVDNASPGDDAERLRQSHAERHWQGRVTLHFSQENLGFGRGNNLALGALWAGDRPPAFVFFLNPDACLASEAVDVLAGFLEQHPEAAVAGAAIVRPDGTPVRAAFRFPSALSEFVQTVNLGVLSRLIPRAHVSLPADIPCQAVDWVSGAAVMVRSVQLAEIGFFDPDFFLYFEETELMWRFRQAGHLVWHVPKARIIHVAGAATGMRGGRHESRAQPAYWYDSWRLYYVKTRGVARARMAAMAHIVGACINIAVQALRGRRSSLPSRFFTDFYRYVLYPLLLGDPCLAHPDGNTGKDLKRK